MLCNVNRGKEGVRLGYEHGKSEDVAQTLVSDTPQRECCRPGRIPGGCAH